MGSLFSKPSKKSSQDLKDLRNTRIKYQDYLANVQTNTRSDISKIALTPETGTAIYKVVQNAYDWLKKNPSAEITDVQGNQDANTIEIKRLMSVDIPKRKFNNTLISLPSILDKLISDKTITSDKKYAFLPILAAENAWYNSNKNTASEIDYTQEFQKINDNITTTFVDSSIVSNIKSQLEAAQAIPTSQLNSQLAEYTKKQVEVQKQQVDVQSTGQTILSTTLSVFAGFLIISLCLMCGSFAANMAIGRPPMYRVLYFIYGCIPLFAPFVLFYSIYRLFLDKKIHVYSLIPCSIEPANTRLGRILWHPFYWIPDKYAIDEYNAFMASLPLQVA
jgi:hypothetical protein